MSFGGGAFIGGGGGGLTAPVAAANVKHRYCPGAWFLSNKGANTTQNGIFNSGNLFYPLLRQGQVTKWSVNLGQVAAGSALTVEYTIDGGSNWISLGSVAVGIQSKVADPTTASGTIAAAALIGVRYITDASWTSTTADPQVWLEFEDV